MQDALDEYQFFFAWGPRSESLKDSGERTLRFLSDLKRTTDAVEVLCKEGKSPDDGPRNQLGLKLDAVQSWLAKGVNRTDIGQEIIPQLGYSLNVWNAASSDINITVHIQCGGISPRVKNCCIVDVSFINSETCFDLQLPVLLKIIEIGAQCWEPDSGIFTSFQLEESLGDASVLPSAGWLTYLPGRSTIKYAWPAGCQTRTLNGLGTIIIACQGPFTAKNSEQIRAVESVRAAIASQLGA